MRSYLLSHMAVFANVDAGMPGEPPAKEKMLVPFIDGPKFISKDVGLNAITALYSIAKNDEKIAKLRNENEAKTRYDVMAPITAHIVELALKDNRIDLTAAFAPQGDARVKVLNDALMQSLGTHTIEHDPETGARRRVPRKEVLAYFPPVGENVNKDTPEYRAKDSTYKNWTTRVKQCAQAAQAIIDEKMKVAVVPTADGKGKTLQLSGPGVENIFGKPSVEINDIKTDDLKAKPSMSTLREIATAKHKPVTAGKQGATNGVDAASSTATSGPEAFILMCNTLITSINKHETEFNEDERKALLAVRSAVNDALK